MGTSKITRNSIWHDGRGNYRKVVGIQLSISGVEELADIITLTVDKNGIPYGMKRTPYIAKTFRSRFKYEVK